MESTISLQKVLAEFEIFLEKSAQPLLVILGPTASGKTALSLHLAKKFQGEIISADSRQIYQEMDIGTDKLPTTKQQGIPHHLLDVIKPDQSFTLANFKDAAHEAILEIHTRNHLPMLVGGTGLYINALAENYQIPRVPPQTELRAELEHEAAKKGPEHLYKRLQKLDPEAAAKIHPHNLRYVIRALEINLATEKPKPDQKKHTEFKIFAIGIHWPREQLYERINERVDEQLRHGLLEETEKLLAKYPPTLPVLTSFGYHEIIQFLQKKLSYAEAVDLIKQKTRNYAKRQMTWFRKNQPTHWISGEEIERVL